MFSFWLSHLGRAIWTSCLPFLGLTFLIDKRRWCLYWVIPEVFSQL